MVSQEFIDDVALAFKRCNELEAEINAYKTCSKDHKEKCPDVKCWVQVLRDEQMDNIEELKERLEKLGAALKEIAKSPQYRHVPTWVVIKCEQALKG